MKQYRLSERVKTRLFSLHKKRKYNAPQLARVFGVSAPAIRGMLKRHGYKPLTMSEVKRKYSLNETYFNHLDEDSAYILGLLYADGYNNEDRGCVTLALAEGDVGILEKIAQKLNSNRPITTVEHAQNNRQVSRRLIISSKIMSKRLSELGCVQAKTFKVTFPVFLKKELHRHFIRGYMDGDGWIGNRACSLVGTESLCLSISSILKDSLNINSYISTRHKERNHNIRTLEISGRLQSLKLLAWMYEDSELFMGRRLEKYIAMKNSRLKYINNVRLCSIYGCSKKHFGKGLCRNHYYAKHISQARHMRYMQTRT